MARTEFIGPAQGGEEPAKSKVSASPALVTVERDGQRLVDDAVAVDEGAARGRRRRGSARSSPASGRAARARISAMAAATVASP